jgi:hypothetical protein
MATTDSVWVCKQQQNSMILRRIVMPIFQIPRI